MDYGVNHGGFVPNIPENPMRNRTLPHRKLISRGLIFLALLLAGPLAAAMWSAVGGTTYF
jgi:hypothetical protein